jgi:hypothetical protein
MTSLKKIARSFLDRLPIVAALLVVGVILSKILEAQSVSQQPTDSVANTHDPWFWIFVGWWLFSALVTGMPEPVTDSSFWYVWVYRSFHMIAASGTSFFQNKMYWPTVAAPATANVRVASVVKSDTSEH